ncbi:MAG TPA: hypothetical protein VM846_15410 [Vicinamibacterales bacterium]|nr:hypothetical protein [Vicinamibacterales bacterium]
MRVLRGFVVAGSLAALACGSSTPDSALILGEDASAARGPRTLTSSQSRALQRKITAADEPCGTIAQAYLRDITAGAEAWEVRCSDGAYSVMLSSGGAPGSDVPQALVRRCVEAPIDDPPCFVPRAGFGYGRRNRNPGSRNPGTLNPELGKLLEPMTTKGEKTD